jgi:hypothetical protein
MEQQIKISFLEHRSFAREIKKFNRKYDGGKIGYKSLKKLLQIHFHHIQNQTVFTPKVLKRIDKGLMSNRNEIFLSIGH